MTKCEKMITLDYLPEPRRCGNHATKDSKFCSKHDGRKREKKPPKPVIEVNRTEPTREERVLISAWRNPG